MRETLSRPTLMGARIICGLIGVVLLLAIASTNASAAGSVLVPSDILQETDFTFDPEVFPEVPDWAHGGVADWPTGIEVTCNSCRHVAMLDASGPTPNGPGVGDKTEWIWLQWEKSLDRTIAHLWEWYSLE